MIEKLSIKNVALIDSAEIEFSSGLNVLSGETGAGKSVILDSINFVLGAKADKTMIRHGETECFVRAVFRIPETSEAIKALEEMDIESDGLVVVSRKLNDVGKSSIKINGVPVSATMLRQVTSHLVDVHGQSEHFYLLKEANQLKVLDKAVGAEATSLKAEIAKHRGDRRELIEKIRSLGGDEAERERKIDVFRFQIEEIERVNPVDGEEEELLAKQNKLNHMERIVEAVQLASSYLNDERGALNAIAEAKRAIGGISKYDGAYDELCERLESLRVDAEDIGETLSDLEQSTYYDEEEANAVDSRLDALKMIKRKYGGSIEAALAFFAICQRGIGASSPLRRRGGKVFEGTPS
ncbi:MAG: AAA family ATPase [Clostridia bacterium]|nr:AAA family ATPase [Clostridia bacterium]